MKKIIYTLTVIIAMMTSVSCGSKVNPDRNIAIARNAIAAGNYTEALSALDEVSDAMTDTTASPKALAQVAVLYSVIDENNHSEVNQFKALKCYELAMKISADSVRECFSQLSENEQMMLDLLSKLHTASHDISEFAEHSEDDTAIYADTLQIINDMDIMQ